MTATAHHQAGAASVHAVLAGARKRIAAIDARILLSALLVRDAAYLIAHPEQVLSPEEALTFQAWTARRAAGEPVAYIVGAREFYGRSFRVTPAVLIPRPETELLVDVALAALGGCAAPEILDLGTGSGCIALTLAAECPQANVTAVDVSEAALAVARANARALALERVNWRLGEWYVPLGMQRYDLIVANPPYVAAADHHLCAGDLRFEPREALTPGGDGTGALCTIIEGARARLARGGWLWLEHGYDQAALCGEWLVRAGFADIAAHCDLAGIVRVSGGRVP